MEPSLHRDPDSSPEDWDEDTKAAIEASLATYDHQRQTTSTEIVDVSGCDADVVQELAFSSGVRIQCFNRSEVNKLTVEVTGPIVSMEVFISNITEMVSTIPTVSLPARTSVVSVVYSLDVSAHARIFSVAAVRWLGLHYGLHLERTESGPNIVLDVHSPASELALEAFWRGDRSRVELVIQGLLSTLEDQRSKHIHVFIDNTNVYLGAQWVKQDHGRDLQRDMTIRVDVERFINVVEEMRTCEIRFVTGSYPTNPIWDRYRQCGYETHAFESEPGSVDETLHGKMYEHIGKSFRDRHTLVLVTGDGNSNQGRSNFPKVIEDALRGGWGVEVWSWRRSASNVYSRFKDAYFSSFALRYLDDYRDLVTFKAAPRSSKRAERADCGRRGSARTRKRALMAVGGRAQIHTRAQGNGSDTSRFECPISLEVMTDPVITPYGHSFQRSEIEAEIRRTGLCPMTKQPLSVEQLIPNRALQSAIGNSMRP